MSRSKECREGVCGVSKETHSSHSCGHGEYGECCGKCHCGSECRCCGSECCQEGNFTKELFRLADEAWMEVLKEKIKDRIRTGDKQIEALAKIVAEANKTRWKDKIATKKVCDDFHDQIKNFFQHK